MAALLRVEMTTLTRVAVCLPGFFIGHVLKDFGYVQPDGFPELLKTAGFYLSLATLTS